MSGKARVSGDAQVAQYFTEKAAELDAALDDAQQDAKPELMN